MATCLLDAEHLRRKTICYSHILAQLGAHGGTVFCGTVPVGLKVASEFLHVRKHPVLCQKALLTPRGGAFWVVGQLKADLLPAISVKFCHRTTGLIRAV